MFRSSAVAISRRTNPRVVQSALPSIVGQVEPAWAQHGDQHVTGAHGAFDLFLEVDAGLHFDVPEDLAVWKVAAQLAVEFPSIARAVLSTIADENPQHALTIRRFRIHGRWRIVVE